MDQGATSVEMKTIFIGLDAFAVKGISARVWCGAYGGGESG